MEKTTVYDLPTRIFLWLFATLFIIAFSIAKILDDDNPLFSYHMLAGISLLFILALRIIWGIFGTKYARFTSFKLNPSDLITYFKQAVVAKTKVYLSHNPASSYISIFMFALTIGLGISGINMALGNKSEFFEESHEIMANLFIISVIAHLVGIIYHHLRHKDSLWTSMIDGKKDAIPRKIGIATTRPIIGILFLVMSLSWMGFVYSNFDRNTRILTLFGNELLLGENEGSEYKSSSNSRYKYEEDDDD